MFAEHKISEMAYCRNSNFKCLPKDNVGVESLRQRLSRLLFEHIKQELPKLRSDLDKALEDNKYRLSALGDMRSRPEDCKEYLSRLSLDFHRVYIGAINRHYEGNFFRFIQIKHSSRNTELLFAVRGQQSGV